MFVTKILTYTCTKSDAMKACTASHPNSPRRKEAVIAKACNYVSCEDFQEGTVSHIASHMLHSHNVRFLNSRLLVPEMPAEYNVQHSCALTSHPLQRAAAMNHASFLSARIYGHAQALCISFYYLLTYASEGATATENR